MESHCKKLQAWILSSLAAILPLFVLSLVLSFSLSVKATEDRDEYNHSLYPQYDEKKVDRCSRPDQPVCGDGVVEGDEECDDGNYSNNDECTNECKINVCGDGILWKGVELCDGGDKDERCSEDCKVCSQIVCGDGIPAGDEECDDGNTEDGDGCSADCKEEPPCTPEATPPPCTPTPTPTASPTPSPTASPTPTPTAEPTSSPTPSPGECGNAVVEEGEECDDGNTESGDGCSATCTDEDDISSIAGTGGDQVEGTAGCALHPASSAEGPLTLLSFVAISFLILLRMRKGSGE